MAGVTVLMVLGAAPPSASQALASSAPVAGWEEVQTLDNRSGIYPVDEPTVTRAGTSVITWVGGAIWRGDVYTSVRRPGDSEWSPRDKVHGKFAIEHVVGRTAGADDAVLFLPRRTTDGDASFSLSVRRLEGHSWTTLDSVRVPAPVTQAQFALNDNGDLAVVWLSDHGTTLGGAVKVGDEQWTALPSYQLDPMGERTLAHAQLRNDGLVAAVTTARATEDALPTYEVLTTAADTWDIETLQPDGARASEAIVASSTTGGLAVTWVEQREREIGGRGSLVARVRDSGDESFDAPAVLTEKWACGLRDTYCAEVAVVDTGDTVALWMNRGGYDGYAYGAVRDASSDQWSPSRRVVPESFISWHSVHPDGTTVVSKGDDETVYVCHLLEDCTAKPAPEFYAHDRDGSFAYVFAGPNGSAYAVAYKENCGDFCLYGKVRAAYLPAS